MSTVRILIFRLFSPTFIKNVKQLDQILLAVSTYAPVANKVVLKYQW